MSGYPSRCQHLKINGTQCGSPALRRNRFCFFHKRFQDEQIRLSADRARRGTATFILPVLEDANSIQIALMQVMRLLLAQQIDHRTASLLLSALRTASANLRMTKFDPWRHEVVLDPRTEAHTPLGSHLWDDQDFEEEEEGAAEPDQFEREANRAAAEAQAYARKRQKSADNLKEWAARNPDVELLWDEGNFTVKPKVPPPDLKKPAATSKPEEIRAQISDMVRKQLLPTLSEKFPPGKQHDHDKEPQKKAT